MRVVLDTNQLVRALMRPPPLATLLMSWESDAFTVLCSPELLDEYNRVLTYPEVAPLIYPELLRTFRSSLQYAFEPVDLPNIPHICRDPDDDKVIATALYGLADYLVTEDEDLLTPAIAAFLAAAGVAIISTADLIRVLDQTRR